MIPKSVKSFMEFRLKNMNELKNYPPAELKKTHGRMGKKALKEIAKELGLRESKVSYNPSGTIDAGYVNLIGMLDAETGIYIDISSSGCLSRNILYRNVKHMKDWTGGTNRFMTEKELLDYKEAINQLKRAMQKKM